MSASWRIHEGDCREVLPSLPALNVHTVVTSPPYYGLRDYGTPGQLGLEGTPDEYVAALVAVFREVRRVLRDDGTVWLNLGDSYAGAGYANRDLDGHGSPAREFGGKQRHGSTVYAKSKDLLGIPWMVAFALRADGWYLRSDIIWSKPNPLPESVTDRPTKAHEYVFLLSKGPRYFYDADAIREADGGWDHRRSVLEGQPSLEPSNGLMAEHKGLRTTEGRNGAGRNKRSVWTVATLPYAGAHFATFPSKLIEPCILAGSPERACGECGAPWVRVVQKPDFSQQPKRGGDRWGWRNGDRSSAGQAWQDWRNANPDVQLGFEPSCPHGDGSARGVVLDPFCGAATTGMVAAQHGRDFIGIELSPKYAALGRERVETFVRLGFRSPNGNGHIAPEQDTLWVTDLDCGP